MGFLAQSWNMKSEGMVREFTQPRTNDCERTQGTDPEAWTAEQWAEVYNFPKKRNGWASQTDKFGSSKFSNPVNPKDGFVVSNCVNLPKRRVLKFVVPMLYPEKPTRVTVTMENSIFGSL